MSSVSPIIIGEDPKPSVNETDQDAEQDPWTRFKALPESHQQLVEALKGIEAQQQQIRYQFQLEELELKKKYAGLLDPLYKRRKAIVTGASNPTDKELDTGEKGLRRVLGKEFRPPSRHSVSGGLDDFWVAVWMNHPGLSGIVATRDAPALEHLTDIRCTYFTGGPTSPPLKSSALSYATVASGTSVNEASTALIKAPSSETKDGREVDDKPIGYKLFFDFKSNPYFENETLEKTYYYKRHEVDDFGELLYSKAVGCQIRWKSGQDLIAAQPTGDAEDDAPSVSFFTFFEPRIVPPKAEADLMTDEDYGTLLDSIEGDFECGEDIRDEIIPYALTYLLDPSYDDDDDDDDDEGDDEEDGHDEEEDEGDEDSD